MNLEVPEENAGNYQESVFKNMPSYIGPKQNLFRFAV